jgi:hypothetical protein
LTNRGRAGKPGVPLFKGIGKGIGKGWRLLSDYWGVKMILKEKIIVKYLHVYN